jgi:sulfate adenylyltransferase
VPELITPHGGTLNERLLTGDEAAALAERAKSLPTVTLDNRQVTDIELLGVGALSPLSGFMGKADYDNVIDEIHLASGPVWSIPVTLGVPAEEARSLVGKEVALVTPEGVPLAVMEVAEAYDADRPREALKVYGTDEQAHPGVEAIYAQGDTLVGGAVQVFALPPNPEFPEYRLTPAQTRAYFEEKGWRTVVAFQTRNPVHRAHEYLQKVALETVDGLLLHPLVGETKEGDIPADVRMRCYRVLLDNYYPQDRVKLAVLPASMRYAGPREAIFHALMRQNYGCTHFIVGRDHAGVGNYYGTYEAQEMFDRFAPGEIAITPLKFEHSFFCRACGSMASSRTCPHDAEEHVVLSGTRVRQMLADGQEPPPEFSRPEVARVLIESMRASAEAR